MGERFALPAWNVDAGIDPDLQAAERDVPGDPGERLARETTRDERVEELGIAGRASEELVCLLFRRDEPGAREQRDELLGIVRHRHAYDCTTLAGEAASALVRCATRHRGVTDRLAAETSCSEKEAA
jgi:hypothetical protein